jgi:hypothetical protein
MFSRSIHTSAYVTMTEEATMTDLAPEGKRNHDNDEVKTPGRSPNPKDKKIHRLVPESKNSGC